MKFAHALFILGLLRITTFAAASRDAPSAAARYRAAREDDVPRIKIKVFRGPLEEQNGETFATWGYWIKQPSG